MNRPITLYYAATIGFVLLDFLLGVSIRASFLDPYPSWRAAYYVFCFACLGLMLMHPAWAAFIGIVESLVAMVALILTMGLRVLIVTDQMIESGRGAITSHELVNFVLVAGIAYLAYWRSLKSLKSSKTAKMRPWK